MWFFITSRNVFTSWVSLTTRSKVKMPRDGSVKSHFISFSGVTEPNSRSRIPEYCPSASSCAAIAAPKYLPDCAAAAARVVAPCTGLGTTQTALATARNTAAVRANALAHPRELRADERMTVLCGRMPVLHASGAVMVTSTASSERHPRVLRRMTPAPFIVDETGSER
ncbi:hypothetical protein GCM10010178_40590 [Lentzea flava]|uniref:Uncharacterized protein n=1 Tax=Lentzea flava TaxID=103732 RepID=A0ABQ2ULT3_9PSEU|nr:hypothetical protein GCM10010178_40590 [Lentzea flava]